MNIKLHKVVNDLIFEIKYALFYKRLRIICPEVWGHPKQYNQIEFIKSFYENKYKNIHRDCKNYNNFKKWIIQTHKYITTDRVQLKLEMIKAAEDLFEESENLSWGLSESFLDNFCLYKMRKNKLKYNNFINIKKTLINNDIKIILQAIKKRSFLKISLFEFITL